MTLVSTVGAEEPVEPAFSKELVRIRKHLLILVSIQWAICVIIFAARIYSAVTEIEQETTSNKIPSLIPIFTLTLYYTCGLLFIYKYHRIGILLFASIGIILFLITCFFVIYILLIIGMLGVDYNLILALQFFVVFGLIFGTFVGVVILTLKLAFYLAESIKIHEYGIV